MPLHGGRTPSALANRGRVARVRPCGVDEVPGQARTCTAWAGAVAMDRAGVGISTRAHEVGPQTRGTRARARARTVLVVRVADLVDERFRGVLRRVVPDDVHTLRGDTPRRVQRQAFGQATRCVMRRDAVHVRVAPVHSLDGHAASGGCRSAAGTGTHAAGHSARGSGGDVPRLRCAQTAARALAKACAQTHTHTLMPMPTSGQVAAHSWMPWT